MRVHIIDFANRPNFLHLAQLKQHNICHFYLNEHASTQAFNELEATIQTRYHTLFNGNEVILTTIMLAVYAQNPTTF